MSKKPRKNSDSKSSLRKHSRRNSIHESISEVFQNPTIPIQSQNNDEKLDKQVDKITEKDVIQDDSDSESVDESAAKILNSIPHPQEFVAPTIDSDSDSEPPIDPSSELIPRKDYEALNKLYTKSKQNESSLASKCKDLTTELISNSAKVQAALQMSQNDRAKILGLKKEVKRAWKIVESHAEKEQKSKDLINRLKLEITTGKSDQQQIKSGFGYDAMTQLQIDQENVISNLTKTNQEHSELNNTLSLQILDLKSELDKERTRCQEIMDQVNSGAENIGVLKDVLCSRNKDLDMEIKTREKLETALKTALETIQKKETESSSKTAEIKSLRDSISRLENNLRDEKHLLDLVTKEKDELGAKNNKTISEMSDLQLQISKLFTENNNQHEELLDLDTDINQYKHEIKQIARLKESLTKKIRLLDSTKSLLLQERDALKSTNQSLFREYNAMKTQLDLVCKKSEQVVRERDLAQKNFVKASGAVQKHLSLSKLSDQTRLNLEDEIMGYKDEASKMRKVIYSLERERDDHLNEAQKSVVLLNAKEDELKLKDMLISDSRKKIAEFERKLKEQQALYENVRADRNIYSRNFVESQDEIAETKRKVKILDHQIDQLKEEISIKEAALAKEHIEHGKLDKEKEVLCGTIDKMKQQLDEAGQAIQDQKSEEKKLLRVIEEIDSDRTRQKKEYDLLVKERDILGTQLIRRNDELSLLYEKIKIQSSTLTKGEGQYLERLEDIRVLKLEVKKIRREKAILQSETQTVDGLRQEIFKLQKDILRERTRVKVLEEELESPMNIHRWRKLSGSDPSTFELITKIQTLQKRLISKTEQVVEKSIIINQKDVLYNQIKQVLSRQPGTEVIEECRMLREQSRNKSRECKALASELNMYHTQVNEYKLEIDGLQKSLSDLKKRYYMLRKKPAKEALEKINEDLKANPNWERRFAGGGFYLSNGPNIPPMYFVSPENKEGNAEKKEKLPLIFDFDKGADESEKRSALAPPNEPRKSQKFEDASELQEYILGNESEEELPLEEEETKEETRYITSEDEVEYIIDDDEVFEELEAEEETSGDVFHAIEKPGSQEAESSVFLQNGYKYFNIRPDSDLPTQTAKTVIDKIKEVAASISISLSDLEKIFVECEDFKKTIMEELAIHRKVEELKMDEIEKRREEVKAKACNMFS